MVELGFRADRRSWRTRLVGWSSVGVLVAFAACGGGGASSSSGGSEVQGCEQGDTSAGDSPSEAPEVPDDPAVAFDEAIAATDALSSAVIVDELDMESPLGAASLRGESEMLGDDVFRVEAFVQEPTGDEVTVVMCSDGESVWTHMDHEDFTAELPEGTSWVQASLEEWRDRDWVFGVEDALEIVPVLRGVDKVEDEGTAEVGEVPVRMLSGEVDFEAAVGAATPEEREGLETSLTVEAEGVMMTAEVGLDADGLVRVLTISLQPEDEAAEGAELRMQVEVLEANPEIGAPTPPESDQTVPLSEVPQVEDLLSS